MVYVIQVCSQLASCQHNVYILLCVQWRTPGDGKRNCPKHVEFYSKNKFEKLVHLVGFFIKNYQDARSHEHQKRREYTKVYSSCTAFLSPSKYVNKYRFHGVLTTNWRSNQTRAFQEAGNELAFAIPIRPSQYRVVNLTLIVLMWRIGWAHNNASK